LSAIELSPEACTPNQATRQPAESVPSKAHQIALADTLQLGNWCQLLAGGPSKPASQATSGQLACSGTHLAGKECRAWERRWRRRRRLDKKMRLGVDLCDQLANFVAL